MIKRTIIISILLLILALCLPLLFVNKSSKNGVDSDDPSDLSNEDDLPPVVNSPQVPSANKDSSIAFVSLVDGELYDVTMEDYLPGVLAGEMPASFEAEALKAQAVAARTYILYAMSHENQKHPDADVCSDATCCKAYMSEETLRERWGDNYDLYWAKMVRAVSETDGQYIVWEGEIIQAVFHSSSLGKTEDSGNVWNAFPYLISVDSPETEADVPNFVTTVEVSVDDFKQTILRIFPDAKLSGEPGTWIGETSYLSSGRVDYISVGGVEIQGTSMRSMFTLRAANFKLKYTGEHFLFTVSGYGHGVGLSQYGANVMAKSGKRYEEILSHYYPGTEIVYPSSSTKDTKST